MNETIDNVWKWDFFNLKLTIDQSVFLCMFFFHFWFNIKIKNEIIRLVQLNVFEQVRKMMIVIARNFRVNSFFTVDWTVDSNRNGTRKRAEINSMIFCSPIILDKNHVLISFEATCDEKSIYPCPFASIITHREITDHSQVFVSRYRYRCIHRDTHSNGRRIDQRKRGIANWTWHIRHSRTHVQITTKYIGKKESNRYIFS